LGKDQTCDRFGFDALLACCVQVCAMCSMRRWRMTGSAVLFAPHPIANAMSVIGAARIYSIKLELYKR